MKSVLIMILFSGVLFAQAETYRWEKKDPVYVTESKPAASGKNSLFGYMQQGYKFFISDLDGGNCPFYPSCSAYFVEAASRTNIISAALMFADRFTRDSNLFKLPDQYPRHPTGKFYDPVENHLHDENIIHIHY